MACNNSQHIQKNISVIFFFNKTYSPPNPNSPACQKRLLFQVLLLPHPQKWQPGDRDRQLSLLHRLLPLVPHLKQLRGSHLRESDLHQPRHIRLCDLPRPTGGEPSLDCGRSETSAEPHLPMDLCKRCLLRHLHGEPPNPSSHIWVSFCRTGILAVSCHIF